MATFCIILAFILFSNIQDGHLTIIGVVRPCGLKPTFTCVQDNIVQLSACTPSVGGFSLDPYYLAELWYDSKSVNITERKTSVVIRGLNASTCGDFYLDYLNNVTVVVIYHPLFTETSHLRLYIHELNTNDIVIDTNSTDSFGQVTTRMEIAGTSNLNLTNCKVYFKTDVAPVFDYGTGLDTAIATDPAVAERFALAQVKVNELIADEGYNRSRAITQGVFSYRVCNVTLLYV